MKEAPSGVSGAGPAQATILVVDDEPRNVQLLQDLLEVRGYTVWTAKNGEQGLSLACERVPDAVLLDVMMPGMNGFDVCRQLKADQRTAMIPVLLVTSLDARQDRLAGIGSGANDFITKPIDSADLLLRVRNAVTTKRLHDEIAAQFRRLKELEAARDTLTHMLVHDMRSPLTGLQGYLDLLRIAVAAGASDDALDCARDAHATAARLKDMVSQVLDVSRLEAGRMPVLSEETDLVQLVPTAVATLGPAPPAVRVLYQLPRHAVVVNCDRGLISRVLVNLLGNAFKFTPGGGEIRVGLEAWDGRARITVADTGPGIAPEHREMIFEKFAQAPLGRVGASRSTGLGLTFCKLAMEAHGGGIGVENGDGGGARFWLELPRNAVAPGN